jgi:hypothetical protein
MQKFDHPIMGGEIVGLSVSRAVPERQPGARPGVTLGDFDRAAALYNQTILSTGQVSGLGLHRISLLSTSHILISGE